MLLLNTFDMAEDTINIDNVGYWMEELNRTYTEQFAAISSKVETCNLQNELNTVISVCAIYASLGIS